MTLITFQDGKPVMRDGKVGTGQGCCCGGAGPACCVDGVCDSTKATAEQCAAAGGQWHPDKTCNDPCWCCSYKYACQEEVRSLIYGSWPRNSTEWWGSIEQIPSSQPPGTVRVFANRQTGGSPVSGCPGENVGKQYGVAFGQNNSLCEGAEDYRGIAQTYGRIRIVDSCDECVSDPIEWEYPGRIICCDEDGNRVDVSSCDECPTEQCGLNEGAVLGRVVAISCTQLGPTSCLSEPCIIEAGISICANPFP